jgi:hypothetical protein
VELPGEDAVDDTEEEPVTLALPVCVAVAAAGQ